MKFKRGQVTAFIIVGIILLVLAGGIIYLSGVIKKSEVPEVTSGIKPIENLVKQCMSNSLEQAMILLKFSGGTLEGKRYDYQFYDVAVWNASTKITRESIEKELSFLASSFTIQCINDSINSFPDYKLILPKESSSEILLSSNSVVFNFNYPIEIIEDSTTSKLSLQKITKPSNILVLLEHANKIKTIVDESLPEQIPFSNLLLYAKDNNGYLEVNQINLENHILLAYVDSPNGEELDKTFVFIYPLPK